MDALVPALIAVFLSELGGKTQSRAYALGFNQPHFVVLAALALASLASYGAGVGAGWAIGKMIAFDARILMFGLALVLAGAPMLVPLKNSTEIKANPGFFAMVFGFVRSQFGDAAQFIVFALAARTMLPFLSLNGGLVGVLAAAFLPMALGNMWLKPNQLRLLRMAIGIALSVWGVWVMVGALKIVGA